VTAVVSAPRLEGQLSCLRPFTAADEEPFLSQVDHPEMFEFMKFRFATRKDAADGFAWLMDLQQRAGPQDPLYWAVETNDSPFVGWAGLGRSTPEHGDEIGWYLLPPSWGRGYASDATTLLLRFGFDVLGAKRMVATCDPDNIASKRVMEKAGMTCKGLLVEPVETWRGPRPRLLYATSSSDRSE
jgi:RimJ/RimL family protein N-acetyltransferase